MTPFLVDYSPGRPTVATITPRQARVLTQLVNDGADNPTIARRIGTTETAVKETMTQLLDKSGMPTRTALAVAVLRHDVVFQVAAPHEVRRAGRRAPTGVQERTECATL